MLVIIRQWPHLVSIVNDNIMQMHDQIFFFAITLYFHGHFGQHSDIFIISSSLLLQYNHESPFNQNSTTMCNCGRYKHLENTTSVTYFLRRLQSLEISTNYLNLKKRMKNESESKIQHLFFFASEHQRATVFITCSSEKITVSHVNMRSYVRVK